MPPERAPKSYQIGPWAPMLCAKLCTGYARSIKKTVSLLPKFSRTFTGVRCDGAHGRAVHRVGGGNANPDPESDVGVWGGGDIGI